MVLYTCEKCGKPFNRKSNYEQHLNKKNPCIYNNSEKVIYNNSEKVIYNNSEKVIYNNSEKVKVKVIIDNKTENKIKFIDLFSGIGSFHYSFKKLGWECVMASDINKAARDTYKENHLLEPLGDIIKIDPKTISKPKAEIVPKTKNKGEAGEEFVIKKLFNLNKNKEYDTLITLLGTDASEGITLNVLISKKIEK